MSSIIRSRSSLADYINVLKPKETSLLVYIGICTAVVAAAVTQINFPIPVFILTVIAIALGSAGANGLTNYLDRDVDARMKRTCARALPSGRIHPPEKALPLIIGCMLGALILSWILSPVCCFIGLVGFLASGIWRKSVTCTYFGIIAGSAPVLIGWYAVSGHTTIDLLPVMFFCLIAAWTPLHVWTLMLANRKDYEEAGLHYFPLSWKDSNVIKVLAVLSVLLAFVSVLIYLLPGKFHWIYLAVSSILSLIMILASIRLLLSPTSENAWSVYKYTAFPYLGIIFTAMVVDIWLL
ncbi:MAG: protoheme IX farnesyltransferase [Chloroflexi bacterium]|nr:protoheme IX farnesyltransferase [Chloroflexota bacterium]